MEQNNSQSLNQHWWVPNRVFLSMSIVVIALTVIMLVIAYPLLPANIPVHFNLTGFPYDTMTKSWWTVFFPAGLQIILTAFMWWLSKRPQYSNIPNSTTLQALPEPVRTKVKYLLAHLLVMTALLADLMFAYIAMAVVRVGIGLDTRLNSLVIFGLVGLLLVLIAMYTIWIRRLILSHRSVRITG